MIFTFFIINTSFNFTIFITLSFKKEKLSFCITNGQIEDLKTDWESIFL